MVCGVWFALDAASQKKLIFDDAGCQFAGGDNQRDPTIANVPKLRCVLHRYYFYIFIVLFI